MFSVFFKVYFATPVVLAVRNISVAIQKQGALGCLDAMELGNYYLQILTGEEDLLPLGMCSLSASASPKYPKGKTSLLSVV